MTIQESWGLQQKPPLRPTASLRPRTTLQAQACLPEAQTHAPGPSFFQRPKHTLQAQACLPEAQTHAPGSEAPQALTLDQVSSDNHTSSLLQLKQLLRRHRRQRQRQSSAPALNCLRGFDDLPDGLHVGCAGKTDGLHVGCALQNNRWVARWLCVAEKQMGCMLAAREKRRKMGLDAKRREWSAKCSR